MLIGIDASRNTVRPRTGTEGYSYSLTRELIGLGSAHRFRLYFNSAPGVDDYPRGLADLRVLPAPRLWTHYRLSGEMLAHRPDVLFVPAHVLPIVHPRRSVVTVHDLGYLKWPAAHPRKRWWYLHLSTQYMARAATLVIADSQATRDDLIRHYRIPSAKIRVVHLGCGDEFFPQSESTIDAVRKRHRLFGDYILTVGTLQPRKNLVRLIEAFASAREQLGMSAGEGIKLAIAGGPGYQAEDVYRAAAPLGEAVKFLGYAQSSNLPALISGARALVFPSLYEGFGLPPLEAMACGTPVIASNTTSLPEVVGEAGLLISPTDTAAIARAIVDVLSDALLAAALRERGLARARAFTWRRCAQETLAVIEEAVAR